MLLQLFVETKTIKQYKQKNFCKQKIPVEIKQKHMDGLN